MSSHNTIESRRVYQASQQCVAKAVRSAKEKWVESVVAEAEATKSDGAIGKLRKLNGGCRTVSVAAICDQSGAIFQVTEAIRAKWKEHFSGVLTFRVHMIPRL